MKEFIDKLIERLEELQQCQIEKYTKSLDEGNLACIYDKTDIEDAKVSAVWKVLDIVTQLAEEYKGGWVPCSERLPDTSEWSPSTIGKYFLVSCEVDSESDPWVLVKLFEKKTSKFCCDCGKVIAWQPLPAPYTEGE